MDLFSEESYLEVLQEYFPSQRGELLVPPGDDCAVFNWESPMCISSDLFIQDVHFRLSYFSPEDIGYKSLAINISDISAMGAMPLGFQMNVMLPEWVEEKFWRSFLQGMSTLAREYDLLLLGGDLVKADKLGVSMSILGKSSQRYLQRAAVSAGDILFLLGDIGLARTGFSVLEQGRESSGFADSVSAHLRPSLHVHAANSLAAYPSVRGLMDVSDGLMIDLPRFLGKKLGAELSLCREDLHAEVLEFAEIKGVPPESLALQGGEDYALLGACSPDEFGQVKQDIPELKKIGQVSTKKGIFLQGQKLGLQGFDHFG